MKYPPQPAERLRILLASARPMAARILKLQVRFSAGNALEVIESFESIVSVLEEEMKLAVLYQKLEDDSAEFHLSNPLPKISHLESRILECGGVEDVTHKVDSKAEDVFRPGEELAAIVNGLNAMELSAEVAVLDHVRPRDLRDHLDTNPGYDVLILSCHGNRAGVLLLEDGRGWARYIGAAELADIVGGRAKVFLLGACHGERSLDALFNAEEGRRPSVIISA